ncbi:MAG: hypothetical protein ACRBBW_20440 [Cellvibrionaceae bacterium]
MKVFPCIDEALEYAQIVANRFHPSGTRRAAFLVQYGDMVSVQTNRPTTPRRVMLKVKPTPFPQSKPSRLRGVNYQTKQKNYRAYLVANGKQIHIGLFEDYFEAVCAKLSTENRLRRRSDHQ